mmetsp:Transcript_63318/g.182127  ORF Transcript_63318/g.182127 Transcript_63318/m.182127 type:complete len:227 (-) Transcript_63318:454-1134(-)
MQQLPPAMRRATPPLRARTRKRLQHRRSRSRNAGIAWSCDCRRPCRPPCRRPYRCPCFRPRPQRPPDPEARRLHGRRNNDRLSRNCRVRKTGRARFCSRNCRTCPRTCLRTCLRPCPRSPCHPSRLSQPHPPCPSPSRTPPWGPARNQSASARQRRAEAAPPFRRYARGSRSRRNGAAHRRGPRSAASGAPAATTGLAGLHPAGRGSSARGAARREGSPHNDEQPR